MPSCLLKRKMRGSFTHHTPFTIEKVCLLSSKSIYLQDLQKNVLSLYVCIVSWNCEQYIIEE